MKTLLLCSIVLSVLVLSGCVDRYFKYTVNMNISGTWHIDQTSSFNASSFLTSTLDIPSDADITEVNIESLTLTPRVLTGHTATSVQASAVIRDCVGTQQTLFPSQSFALVGIEFIPDNVITAGVAKLQSLVNDFAKNKQFLPCNQVFLAGTVSGGRAVLDIDYSIKATIKYGRCEQILSILGSTGDDCPGSSLLPP
jgi:hypothetical protein